MYIPIHIYTCIYIYMNVFALFPLSILCTTYLQVAAVLHSSLQRISASSDNELCLPGPCGTCCAPWMHATINISPLCLCYAFFIHVYIYMSI